MVEHQIMAHGAFEVAKALYHLPLHPALVRQSNTTDDKILSLIECNNEEAKQENSNKNPVVNSTQRDYMAERGLQGHHQPPSAPAKDIVDAHNDGIIHFHDTDYFAQHMHNCDLVNLEDMLQNGTGYHRHPHRAAPQLFHRLQHRHADYRPGGLQPVWRPVHLPGPSGPLCSGQPRENPPRRAQEIKAIGIKRPEEDIRRLVEDRLRKKSAVASDHQYQVVTLLTTNGQGPSSPCSCI